MGSLRREKTIFECEYFSIIQADVEQKESSRAIWIRRNDSVIIVPRLANGDMVLVYQYRVPTGNVELEFPGGGVELGEPPEMAAARELKEETGLSDGRFKARGRFYLSNGASNEQVHIFSVDIASDHLPTSSGELATVAMPPIEVARKISNGTITCAPSALAYMLVSPQLVADD